MTPRRNRGVAGSSVRAEDRTATATAARRGAVLNARTQIAEEASRSGSGVSAIRHARRRIRDRQRSGPKRTGGLTAHRRRDCCGKLRICDHKRRDLLGKIICNRSAVRIAGGSGIARLCGCEHGIHSGRGLSRAGESRYCSRRCDRRRLWLSGNRSRPHAKGDE